jgi:hypothetical protein
LTKIRKGTVSAATQRIVVDAGAAITPELIAILGHNFTTETISIQANSADAWGAPAYDFEFTSISDLMFKAYTGTAYRYWSILIENCKIPLTPPEIGLLYFGDYETIAEPSAITPSAIDDNSTFEKSQDNTLHGTKGETIRQNFQLKFELLTEAQFTLLKTIFIAVGKAIAFIVIWDLTTNYVAVPNIYCYFITGISLVDLIGYTIPGISITIEECK